MTGAEHYREAEDILADAKNADSDANPANVALLLQFATVHATLAQVAATADAGGLTDTNNTLQWDRVINGGER